MANAQLDSMYYEDNLGEHTSFKVSWKKSFDQAWRSMHNVIQRDHNPLDWVICYDNIPERLEDKDIWDIWRNEILEILNSF